MPNPENVDLIYCLLAWFDNKTWFVKKKKKKKIHEEKVWQW